jgi:AraC-like DNA-binding protein
MAYSYERHSSRAEKLHLVQAGVLFPTLNYARQIGVDLPYLIRKSQLPAEVFEDPTQRVPALSWPRVFDEIRKETGFEDIGWRVAANDPLQYYPTQFNEFANAPTLLEGLRHICRANSVFSNNQHIWLRFTRDYAYACHFDEDRGPGYAQRTAFRTGIGVEVIRNFLGPGWCPGLILTETSLDALPDRDSLAGARIMRSRGFGAVQIPRFLLCSSSRRLHRQGYQADTTLAPSLPEEIRRLLKSHNANSLPGAQSASEILHLSERTLQRRLSENSVSYSVLVDSARFESASELLRSSSMRIFDVAISQGFDDQSHFTRFFRRLGGVTPSAYRKHYAINL